jgi:hypothetical protein
MIFGTPGIIADAKYRTTIVAIRDLIGRVEVRSPERGIAVARGTRLAPGSIKTFRPPGQSNL